MLNFSLKAPMLRCLYLLVADFALIWGAYFFYRFNAYYSSFLNKDSLFILFCVSVFFATISIKNLIQNRNNERYVSKGYVFWKTIINGICILVKKNRNKSFTLFVNSNEKTIFLFTLVKLFFIPIMLQFAVANYNDFYTEVNRIKMYVAGNSWMNDFNNVFYPLALSLFFFADTMLFTFGYLFEASFLKNNIRSVDTTWLGWCSALACYPPLNEVFSKLAPQQSFNYAYFGSIEFTFGARFLMTFLLLIYALASVSLGTKCSNLTNRGIVTNGVYSIVRHPAYVSKVFFWWITIIPLMKPNPLVICSMIVWTFIYFLRAVTEERHLSNDPDYVSYCKVVKYRFLPFVY